MRDIPQQEGERVRQISGRRDERIGQEESCFLEIGDADLAGGAMREMTFERFALIDLERVEHIGRGEIVRGQRCRRRGLARARRRGFLRKNDVIG